MMQRVLNTRWDLVRWLRLSLGLIMIYSAITMQDYLAGALGLFFSAQALLNVGCCTTNACYDNSNYSSSENVQEVSFEEIKTK